MTKPLPKVLWLWLPLAFMAIQFIIEFALDGPTLSILHSEGGPHESLQALIVAAAFVLAIVIFIKMKSDNIWLRMWIALAAICSLYVTGEEISWGQHILDWSTPDFWAGLNDQGETNLHNTSSWFDQKPRLILLIGAITGGLLIPAAQRWKPKFVPQRFTIIYPPATLGITAALAISTNLLDKVFESLRNEPFFARGSEVEEVYLFYFVLLYLIALRRRLI